MSANPEPNSARYFALLYSPETQRAVLDALFGIENEVSNSLRPGLDHHVAHSRLQWWREECERAANRRAVHPLTKALVDALKEPLATSPASLTGLTGFVDVTVWDLAGATFETRRELTAYCERWAAAMIEPLVAGATPLPSSLQSTNWRALGAAMREIELLANLAREAHYGRLRVPLDELDTVKADPGSLAKTPLPEAVANLLRVRHKSLRDEMVGVLGALDPEQQPRLRGLLVWVALVWRSSLRAELALPDGLRAGRFDAVADAWFAWRIARRATIGRFRLN
jgi:phytoene/squalene synthetase